MPPCPSKCLKAAHKSPLKPLVRIPLFDSYSACMPHFGIEMVVSAPFEFALFSRFRCSLAEVILFRLIKHKNFIIRHMAEEITSLLEEGLSNDQMSQDATLDPMETVIKELADLRRVSQKLNKRLDSMLHPQAKKRLFNQRKRSSVDPSCSVSIIFNDLIAFVRTFYGELN